MDSGNAGHVEVSGRGLGHAMDLNELFVKLESLNRLWSNQRNHSRGPKGAAAKSKCGLAPV